MKWCRRHIFSHFFFFFLFQSLPHVHSISTKKFRRARLGFRCVNSHFGSRNYNLSQAKKLFQKPVPADLAPKFFWSTSTSFFVCLVVPELIANILLKQFVMSNFFSKMVIVLELVQKKWKFLKALLLSWWKQIILRRKFQKEKGECFPEENYQRNKNQSQQVGLYIDAF